MTHPVSIRFRDETVVRHLKNEADARGKSTSALAEELIDEALRMRRHPQIAFRDGPAGRRAAVVGGPDVWEVVRYLLDSDVAATKRIERAADHLNLRRGQVEAALAYYAEHTDEIDAFIARNKAEADEAEAIWHRQRDLLAR